MSTADGSLTNRNAGVDDARQAEAGFSIGAHAVGTTSSYAQDVGDLRLPGVTQVNGFAQWRCTDRLLFSLDADKLFDVRGVTEAEDGAIPANGIVRARSINGRTTSLTLRVTLVSAPDGDRACAASGARQRRKVARPAGFEPATTSLEGSCSIQLSYGRARSSS